MTGPEQDVSGAGSDPVALAAEALAAGGVSGVVVAPAEDPRALVEQIVQVLAEHAPADFTAVHAVFSMAGGKEIVDAVADTPGGVVALPVTLGAMERARAHRELTVGEQGPWLRLLLDVDRDGTLQVGFDYGDTVIPAEHLLPGEAYLADFESYPHADVALWLMAHMGDEGEQMRTAAQAAEADAEDRVDMGAAPRRVDDEIAPLPDLWSRMAALASVCRGLDAAVGPRTDAAFCLYRGDRGGCTLARLPDGRAVLSGGADDSALLTAAYRGEIGFPELYRGAPRWVHNLYLDPRAGAGRLSFCYWWEGGHWHRADIAETPEQWSAADEVACGMPDVSTVASTGDAVVAVLASAGVAVTDEMASAAGEFVRAAEARVSSQRYLDGLFPDGAPAGFDVAEALAQLDAAGVLLPGHAPIGAEAAEQLVAEYCRANQVDVGDNLLDRLVATRMDAGWLVSVPVAEGELSTGQTVFLVADDGVVEAATSGPAGEVAFAFTTRFAARLRSGVT
jgi:hypothetical protein